jgi:hypothetical protein
LPEAAHNPFSLQNENEDWPAPNRRRRSYASGILCGLTLLVAVGGPLAYFQLRKKQEPVAAPSPPVANSIPAAQLDLKIPDANQPRINEAIRKGVDSLKKEVLSRDRLYHRSELADVAPANAHHGAIALAGLTLLECGVAPDDPAVQRAAEAIRDAASLIHATYALAAAILFLDRLHMKVPDVDGTRLREVVGSTKAQEDRDGELIRSFALRLMSCQDQGGFWGYGRPVSREQEEKTFQKVKNGNFGGLRLDYKNLSNSQFAALALWAARRHGVPVRPALQAVARGARAQQTPEGTWNYDQNLPMKHTSVCAGLIFLALERGLDEEAGIRAVGKAADPSLTTSILDDVAVKKGMDFLGKFLAKPPSLSANKKEERQRSARAIKDYYEKYETTKGTKVPGVSWTMDGSFGGTIFGADSWGDLYLLWSIERVGVIYAVKEIPPGKGKNWYRWGSEIIVANQKVGGLWEDRFPGVPDTCFALLFLKRANIAKDLTDKLRTLLGWTAASAPPANQAPATPRK